MPFISITLPESKILAGVDFGSLELESLEIRFCTESGRLRYRSSKTCDHPSSTKWRNGHVPDFRRWIERLVSETDTEMRFAGQTFPRESLITIHDWVPVLLKRWECPSDAALLQPSESNEYFSAPCVGIVRGNYPFMAVTVESRKARRAAPGKDGFEMVASTPTRVRLFGLHKNDFVPIEVYVSPLPTAMVAASPHKTIPPAPFMLGEQDLLVSDRPFMVTHRTGFNIDTSYARSDEQRSYRWAPSGEVTVLGVTGTLLSLVPDAITMRTIQDEPHSGPRHQQNM